jgi:peptidyl-prolyl cis-trans isomerase A (cyclophilin A)
MLCKYVAQVSINGDPSIAALSSDPLLDDPGLMSNKRGTLTFAHSGKNTQSAQIFFNLNNNGYLDREGFPPFAEVTRGMDHIDAFYQGHGEGGKGDGTDGKSPNQSRIAREGDEYLKQHLPL